MLSGGSTAAPCLAGVRLGRASRAVVDCVDFVRTSCGTQWSTLCREATDGLDMLPAIEDAVVWANHFVQRIELPDSFGHGSSDAVGSWARTVEEREGAENMDSWNSAIGRIEESLEGDIDVPELARMVLTSEFHFRRMFSVLSGMPLSEYIRRRRLTVAASAVLEGEEAIQDIAVRFGYSSADAFSRAFRVVHGVSPKGARGSGVILRSQPRLVFTLNIEGAEQMNYRLETKEPFALIGLKRRMKIVFEGPNQAMIDFYKDVGSDTVDAIGGLATVEPQGTLTVSTDFSEGREDGSTFEYWMAAAVESNPGDVVCDGHHLDVLEVPALTWLVLSTEDTAVESIQQLWVDAYGKWFPANPYSTLAGPALCVVIYDEQGNERRAEVWLPVQKD